MQILLSVPYCQEVILMLRFNILRVCMYIITLFLFSICPNYSRYVNWFHNNFIAGNLGGLMFKAGGSNMQHVTSLSFLLLAYSNYISHANHVIPCGETSASPALLKRLARRQVKNKDTMFLVDALLSKATASHNVKIISFCLHLRVSLVIGQRSLSLQCSWIGNE